MKKTKVITIRMTEEAHSKLQSEARRREWSVAYTAYRLIESALKSELWAGGHGTNGGADSGLSP